MGPDHFIEINGKQKLIIPNNNTLKTKIEWNLFLFFSIVEIVQGSKIEIKEKKIINLTISCIVRWNYEYVF